MILTKDVIASNLENLLSSLRPVNKGTYYQVECPFCNHREAYVYFGSEWVVCSRQNHCGEKIHIEKFLREKEGLNETEIFNLLTISKKHEGQKQYNALVQKNARVPIPNEVKYLSQDNGLLSQSPRKYLQSRGLLPGVIEGLGYINDSNSEYNKRIFIPFYENGEIVYFVCRDYTGKSSLRYMNPDGFNSRDFLFNVDKIKEDEDVFVVEGVMDALTLEQPTVALLTNTAGKKQADKLFSKAPKDVIFIPDVDKAGITALKKNIETFMEMRPPSSNSNFYIYWLDIARRDKIISILKQKLPIKEESKLIDKIDGIKDLNQSGIKYIDKKDCVLYNKFARELNI